MDASPVVRWFRRKILAEVRLLRDAGSVKWPDKAGAARLRQFVEDGGLLVTGDLAPIMAGVPRAIRLLIQLDGDTMLYVPKDFGEHPDDATRIAGLKATSLTELAQLQAALPYGWASLIAVVSRFGFSGLTLYSAPGAVGSLIGLAPGELLASVPWWHVGGMLCGPLELVFGQSLRRAAMRALEWMLQRAVRHHA